MSMPTTPKIRKIIIIKLRTKLAPLSNTAMLVQSTLLPNGKQNLFKNLQLELIVIGAQKCQQEKANEIILSRIQNLAVAMT